MAPLSREDAPAYLREEVVAEVTSFYDFLISMYLPDGVLQRPPPGGWPHLTGDKLALLDKDEAVLDLIRHLPYIATCWPESYDVHVECECMDYASPRLRSDINTASGQLWIYDMEPNREVTEMGSHEFTLACAKNCNGVYIFYNTKDGKFSSCNGYAHPERPEVSERPQKFFETLKAQFRTFEVVPIGPTQLRWMGREPTSAPRRAAGLLLRKHGWLSDRYDKTACLKEIEALDHLHIKKGSAAVSSYANSLLRDEIVRELTSFYEFLTRTHIPTKALRYPPLGGWQHLTAEALAFMGKSDAVLDLIRHLPYIHHEDVDEPYQIHDACAPVDFTSSKALQAISKGCHHTLQPNDLGIDVHRNEFMLATSVNDCGHFILLNVDTGEIRLCDAGGKSEFHDPISLFTTLKERYRRLELIPTEPCDVYEAKQYDEYEPIKRIQQYLRRSGWLTESYDKAKSMQAVKMMWDTWSLHDPEPFRQFCDSLLVDGMANGLPSTRESS